MFQEEKFENPVEIESVYYFKNLGNHFKKENETGEINFNYLAQYMHNIVS